MKIPSISLIFLITAMMFFSDKAHSQVLFQEDFAGLNNTLPDGWVSTDPAKAFIQNGELRYSNLNYVSYTGSDSVFSPGYEITWNMQMGQFLISNADQANNMYFGYDSGRAPADGPEAYSVGIRKLQSSAPVYLMISAQRTARYNSPYLAFVRIDQLVTLDTSTIYTIKVQYDGESIHSSLYDGSALIATVSKTTGVVPISGQIGFYSVAWEQTDSITLTAVPEPSTLTFSAIVGVFLLGGRRLIVRRKQPSKA